MTFVPPAGMFVKTPFSFWLMLELKFRPNFVPTDMASSECFVSQLLFNRENQIIRSLSLPESAVSIILGKAIKLGLPSNFSTVCFQCVKCDFSPLCVFNVSNVTFLHCVFSNDSNYPWQGNKTRFTVQLSSTLHIAFHRPAFFIIIFIS